MNAFRHLIGKLLFIIGGAQNPYLRRWWLLPHSRLFNVYLHHFCRSDDDRALHDHPWLNVSILLRRRYIEHLPEVVVVRRARCIVIRRAEAAHRIELIDGTVWTVFVHRPETARMGLFPAAWLAPLARFHGAV